MSDRAFRVSLAGIGVVVTLITALGVDVRATYGAQTTADEPQYILSAISLWEDGNLDISDELAEERYRAFHELDLPRQTEPYPDGRELSPHDPLLPLILALPVGVGGWIGVKLALAMMAGGLASTMVWVAHRRLGVKPWLAVLVVSVFSLSPPLAIYATQVYPELSAALLVTTAIAALTAPSLGGGKWLAAAAIVALPWLAVKYVPVAAALAIVALVRLQGASRRCFIAVLVGAGAVYVAGHLWIYDGLTAYSAGDHFVGGEYTAVGANADLWGRSTRLLGLLVDRAFGLGAWQPAFFLVPAVAGWLLARRRSAGPESWLLGLASMGWLVATFVALTMHGWWFPGRQVVILIPVMVLLLARWANESGTRTIITTATGLIGVVSYGFLLVEGINRDLTWVVDFAATANPFYRLLSPLLPDYMAPSLTTWSLHGFWMAVCSVLFVMGWRGANADALAASEQMTLMERHDQQKERMTT